MSKVPHVPWTPQPKQLVSEVDETPWVRNVPIDGGHRDVQFKRTTWPYGGYITNAVCQCGLQYEAGGKAGEESLTRWADRHDCKEEQPVYEVDEDTNLFRN